jgi:hypothetical protein
MSDEESWATYYDDRTDTGFRLSSWPATAIPAAEKPVSLRHRQRLHRLTFRRIACYSAMIGCVAAILFGDSGLAALGLILLPFAVTCTVAGILASFLRTRRRPDDNSR